jgi:hypothetical protein
MSAVTVGNTVTCGKRRANEALLGQRFNPSDLTGPPAELLVFDCECDDVGCSETVRMIESGFRGIARSEGIYVVVPEHRREDEYVIASNGRSVGSYLLVRRHPQAAPLN